MSQRNTEETIRAKQWGVRDGPRDWTKMRYTHTDTQTTHSVTSDIDRLPGRAKMSFRAPSMSAVAKVVGRLRNRNTWVSIFPPDVIIVLEAVVASVILL